MCVPAVTSKSSASELETLIVTDTPPDLDNSRALTSAVRHTILLQKAQTQRKGKAFLKLKLAPPLLLCIPLNVSFSFRAQGKPAPLTPLTSPQAEFGHLHFKM